MYLLKIDSNVMSLSGMVIAIGSMVDMGIIMTENIYSHLAEKKNQPKSGLKLLFKLLVKGSQRFLPPS